MSGGERADGRVHAEVKETRRDPRFTLGWREGSKVGGVAERLDREATQEGQWSFSIEPQGSTQSTVRPLKCSLNRRSNRPFQESNTEGEQSSIVLLLPVVVTLKVG